MSSDHITRGWAANKHSVMTDVHHLHVTQSVYDGMIFGLARMTRSCAVGFVDVPGDSARTMATAEQRSLLQMGKWTVA